MDVENWITLTAVLVAIGSGVVAWFARCAARRAVDAAQRAADVAEREETRAQREAHAEVTPQFELKAERPIPRAQVALRMIEGPDLAAVEAWLVGSAAAQLDGLTNQLGDDSQRLVSLGPMTAGHVARLWVLGGPEKWGSLTITVRLHCTPVDENTQPWEVTRSMTLVQPARLLTAKVSRIPRSTQTVRR